MIRFLLIINSFFFFACTKDIGKKDLSETGYPQEIGEIITKNCATSGCHNNLSRDGAAGLSLETWDQLFEGSGSGAIVIPYKPDFSTLLYYTNTYNEYGTIQLVPTMPIGSEKLSIQEIQSLYNWIKDGAPNANGFVKFSDNPNRKKFYVSNQGCDVITVFDAKSMLAMRMQNVGKTPQIEAPHFIKISPDNKYWYVSFLGSTVFQKYNVGDNTLVGEASIGFGSWNTFALSSDGKIAYVVDWTSNGKVVKVQTDSMLVKKSLPGLIYPHGSFLSKNNDTLYVTSQYGNYIYRITNDLGNVAEIVLDGSGIPNNSSSLDPHEILHGPDKSKLYVTCQKSNQIKVVSAITEQVVATINVGDFPQEMSLVKSKNYLLVSCMEDITTFGPAKRGSIYIINLNNNSIVKAIYTGHQPHGIMVDEVNMRAYITNRNVVGGGPSPHHAAACNGKNGYITAIDLNTLELVSGFKAEVSVDPYGYSITH